jgi:hypothetical protein
MLPAFIDVFILEIGPDFSQLGLEVTEGRMAGASHRA